MDLSCFCTSSEPIVLNHLFKVVCTTNSLGRYSVSFQAKDKFAYNLGRQRQCLPHEQRESKLVRMKDSDSLSCNCMCWCPLALFTPPGGNWGSGNWCKMLLFWLAIDVRNKLSFIFDPGVLGLLPASMNQCQASLLADKQGKISDPLIS